MSKALLLSISLLSFTYTPTYAEFMDSVQLNEIEIKSYRSMNGTGHITDYKDQIIYSGKKTEVLLIDSLEGNKAINNTRQIIGRIPGLNIIETESSGFTANGIAFRGLNPYQSIETNTRQNNYNISADIFGYNEAYYLPPMEAVKSITFVRGASSLAFGPQIGGMINYELKDSEDKPIRFSTAQTFGSFGLINTFNSLGGKYKKFKYYGFIQYRRMEGWRNNSDQKQLSGFVSVKYEPNSKWQIGLEYTALRNKIHMPGGLTDAMFSDNPKQSPTERNWLTSPWNILALKIRYSINTNTSISLTSSYLFSQRNLIWKNEDDWPNLPDVIDSATLQYLPRELEREYFKSTTHELRVLHNYTLSGTQQTFAGGIRFAYSNLVRQEGAEGTTGTNFDLAQLSDWEANLRFKTLNVALFAENTFRIKHFSITPGIRYEFLSNSVNGYSGNDDYPVTSADPFVTANNEKSKRNIVLAGLGMQYDIANTTNFYANFSQSYKPVTYSNLTPFGSTAKVDPNLKDANAYNIDFGYRGTFRNILNFDAGFFFLYYNNRIGTVDSGRLRTNTGSSRHLGVESYVELNILDGLIKSGKYGKLSIYNSFGYTDARYVKGEFKGNSVEYAPKFINRVGFNYGIKGFGFNLQYSYNSSSFGDADNTQFSNEALVGIIPAYGAIDMSASYKWRMLQFKLGINNVANKNYFTLRTDEYPGPGIIPSIGRMFYGGISATF
ncbi:MAG: TonB-dependent receptor [Bacteroidota bacterium]|nr:TonB-dependent receptor [Bacteroidota bacterium]